MELSTNIYHADNNTVPSGSDNTDNGNNGQKTLAGAGALAIAWEVDAVDPEPISKVVLGVGLLIGTGIVLFDDYDGTLFGPFGDPSQWTSTTGVPSVLPTPQGDPNGMPKGPGSNVAINIGAFTVGAILIDLWNGNIWNNNNTSLNYVTPGRPTNLPTPFIYPQPVQYIYPNNPSPYFNICRWIIEIFFR
jgi:hypothetical protein